MKELIRRLLVQYGQAAVIIRRDGTRVETKAFVQPVLGRGQEMPQRSPTPLGMAEERRYRYIGDVELEMGDRVEALGRRFFVRVAEPVRMGDDHTHWWAMLAVDDEEDACE